MALKDNALTATEITSAGGTLGYTYSDTNQTGGMSYHASSSAYGTSAVKSVVDSWASNKFTDELKTVDGYAERLIQYDEIPIERKEICTGSCFEADVIAYDWMYNSGYSYWTMTPWQDGDQPSSSIVWYVRSGGRLNDSYVYNGNGAVRPVINVYKDKISQAI